MKRSWLVTTIIAIAVVILLGYFSNPSNHKTVIAVSGFFVFAVNLFFWLPALAYLRNKRKISFTSSVLSGVSAALVGSAGLIGITYLALYVVEKSQQLDALAGQATGYTSWTIGHIHYWPGVVYLAVFWGLNGIVFWKLYGKFATNK